MEDRVEDRTEQLKDLPLDVQDAINRMSRDKTGKMDETTRAKLTTVAIEYKRLYPERYKASLPFGRGLMRLGIAIDL